MLWLFYLLEGWGTWQEMSSLAECPHPAVVGPAHVAEASPSEHQPLSHLRTSQEMVCPPLPVLGAPPPAWAACPSHSLHGPSLSPFQSQCMTDLSVPTQCGSECHPTSRWWSRVTPWRTGSQLALGTTLVTMGGVGCIRARWSQQGLGEGVWRRRLFREPAGLAAHA